MTPPESPIGLCESFAVRTTTVPVERCSQRPGKTGASSSGHMKESKLATRHAMTDEPEKARVQNRED